MVNIFGGKITTYRRLAESVLERIEGALGHRGAPWTDALPCLAATSRQRTMMKHWRR